MKIRYGALFQFNNNLPISIIPKTVSEVYYYNLLFKKMNRGYHLFKCMKLHFDLIWEFMYI